LLTSVRAFANEMMMVVVVVMVHATAVRSQSNSNVIQDHNATR